MAFYRWVEVKERNPKRGVKMRVISGEKGMMVLFEIEPGVEIETHSHPHEQMGTVLEGEISLVIGGKKRVLKKGDSYIVPSNIPHKAYTLDKKAKVLDFFAPPREEYRVGEENGEGGSNLV